MAPLRSAAGAADTYARFRFALPAGWRPTCGEARR